MKSNKLIQTSIAILFLVVFGLGLNMLFRSIGNSNRPASDPPYPPPVETQGVLAYPPPDPTIISQIATSNAWVDSSYDTRPTDNPIPFPTLIPTPEITPLAIAAFPISGFEPGLIETPFSVIYQEGDALWYQPTAGDETRLLLDVQVELSRFLADSDLGLSSWGSASPDGRYLAIVTSKVAERDQESRGWDPEIELYLFDTMSGQISLIIENGVEPVWSPESNRLAFRGPDQGLWIYDVTIGKAASIYSVTEEHYVTDMSWSPGSESIAFIDAVFRQSTEIKIVDVTGKSENLLVPWEGYWMYTPDWAPDGESIVFVSTAGSSESSQSFDNLWVVYLDGSERQQLSWDFQVHDPSWSPNGKYIAFSGTIAYEDVEPFTDIWLMDVQTRELVRLTSNFLSPVNDIFLGWSPDGVQIMFSREGIGVFTISLISGTETMLSESPVLPQVVP